MNKEIEALAKYVGEYVIVRLDNRFIKVEVWKNKDRRVRRVDGRFDKV